MPQKEAVSLRSRAGRRPRAAGTLAGWWGWAPATVFYVAALAVLLFWKEGGDPVSARVFEVAGVLLYGVLTTFAVYRRPGDRRVWVFLLTGALVTSTLVFPGRMVERPLVLFVAVEVVRAAAFHMAPAVFVHMASLIPRRNPIVRRHAWLLPAVYGAGVAISGVALSGVIGARLRGDNAAAIDWAMGPTATTLTLVGYTVAGALALVLLGTAARREPTMEGRSQAATVFIGVAPWAGTMTLWLVAPETFGRWPLLAVVEPLAILLVPVSFFVAMFGLRLFELPVVVRKSLIVGPTLGVMAGTVYLLWIGAGALGSHILGLKPSLWNVALVMALIGLAARPLYRRVTLTVDRVLYPEKLELRRLQREIIGELAEHTGIDAMADHLVHALVVGLKVAWASLLVADDERRLFRERSRAGSEADRVPREALTVSSAGTPGWTRALGSGLAFALEARVMPAEGGGLLRAVRAAWVVAIALKSDPVALLVLGPPTTGAELDRDDLDTLRATGRQVAAMLENARLFDQASTDTLTRLPRRAVAEEKLADELRRCGRTGAPLTVAMIDVDDFKLVNDTWGHLEGDRVLARIGCLLRTTARDTDLVSRWGGEEFVVIMPETDAQSAVAVAERMVRAVAAAPHRLAAGGDVAVTVSVGVAEKTADDAPDAIGSLLARADRALYRAKRLGKNCTVTADAVASR